MRPQDKRWGRRGGRSGRAKIAEFMAYCDATLDNKESTIAEKLVAENVYHQQFARMSLPLNNPLFKWDEAGDRCTQRRQSADS